MKAKLALCKKCEHFRETASLVNIRSAGKALYACGINKKNSAVTIEDYNDYNLMYEVVPECPYILEQSLL